jgi:hypothetical protein
MATIYELRARLAALRQFLIAQKGGLSKWEVFATTETQKHWFKYAIVNSDKLREELNSIIDYLDELIGEK